MRITTLVEMYVMLNVAREYYRTHTEVAYASMIKVVFILSQKIKTKNTVPCILYVFIFTLNALKRCGLHIYHINSFETDLLSKECKKKMQMQIYERSRFYSTVLA